MANIKLVSCDFHYEESKTIWIGDCLNPWNNWCPSDFAIQGTTSVKAVSGNASWKINCRPSANPSTGAPRPGQIKKNDMSIWGKSLETCQHFVNLADQEWVSSQQLSWGWKKKRLHPLAHACSCYVVPSPKQVQPFSNISYSYSDVYFKICLSWRPQLDTKRPSAGVSTFCGFFLLRDFAAAKRAAWTRNCGQVSGNLTAMATCFMGNKIK